MRKVEFTNLGVTFIFTPAQSNIEVRKNNIPDPLAWPASPPLPQGPFNHAGYVSKFRLVDNTKPSGQTQTHRITLEVRYKKGYLAKANSKNLQLGIHDGTHWLLPKVIETYVIDDRSKKWYGSWLVEVDLPADPLVAWGG